MTVGGEPDLLTADELAKRADASVALLKVGANGEIDVNVARSPTIAFVMTNAGLMADASLEATRISRID